MTRISKSVESVQSVVGLAMFALLSPEVAEWTLSLGRLAINGVQMQSRPMLVDLRHACPCGEGLDA
jgi:hypothetical protein